MKAETITILREKDQEVQTLGHGVLLSDSLETLFEFKSMELPWKDNKRRESCIPVGTYEVIKHVSPKFGPCLWVQDVPGRSEILIHPANYWFDLLGCIGPGENHVDINGDGLLDVNKSGATMRKIMELCPDRLTLIIKNLD